MLLILRLDGGSEILQSWSKAEMLRYRTYRIIHISYRKISNCITCARLTDKVENEIAIKSYLQNDMTYQP